LCAKDIVWVTLCMYYCHEEKGKSSILLGDVYPHWKRLSVQGEEVDENFSVMEEWNTIQERLKRTPYKMKFHIKEAMRQLGFSEDTMLPPPPRKVVTKATPKRVRSTPKLTSTSLIPSRWERVDSQYPDSQSLQPKIKLPKREGARLGT
jgi:hypothetical protein